MPESFCFSSAIRTRCTAIPASVDWSAAKIALERSYPTLSANNRKSTAAYSACLSTASRMPSPNSALSSNRELDQEGPRPAAFEV